MLWHASDDFADDHHHSKRMLVPPLQHMPAAACVDCSMLRQSYPQQHDRFAEPATLQGTFDTIQENAKLEFDETV